MYIRAFSDGAHSCTSMQSITPTTPGNAKLAQNSMHLSIGHLPGDDQDLLLAGRIGIVSGDTPPETGGRWLVDPLPPPPNYLAHQVLHLAEQFENKLLIIYTDIKLRSSTSDVLLKLHVQ